MVAVIAGLCVLASTLAVYAFPFMLGVTAAQFACQTGAGFIGAGLLGFVAAFGVLAAAYQAGLKVGRGDDCDLRIAGHDDHPLSRYTCPPLTTVAQNYNEIGRIAVELLLHKINARFDQDVEPRPNERVLLNAEIMLRTSA